MVWGGRTKKDTPQIGKWEMAGGGGGGREDYVQCAAARLQEQNGSLLHMDSFGAIPRVERNVLACPTLKEPASL